MKILAIETSTEACSAALLVNGETREEFALAPREHAALILPMIDRLMAASQLSPQQLDAVALSRGPGSFTGVRIAAGVAQGIAFGADIPIVKVSTLAAIAQVVFDSRQKTDMVFAALDARMQEIYWGSYRRNPSGLAEAAGEEFVCPPDDIATPSATGFGAGPGWAAYTEQLQLQFGERLQGIDLTVWPRAGAVATLGANGFAAGEAVGAELAIPVYLRNKVAKTKAERER